MISKKVFCDTLREMEKHRKIEDSVNDIFMENECDFNSFSMCGYESVVFNVLEDIFKDGDSSILSYWIYDMDFGKDFFDIKYEDNCGLLPEILCLKDMHNNEELYDYLVKRIDKTQKV